MERGVSFQHLTIIAKKEMQLRDLKGDKEIVRKYPIKFPIFSPIDNLASKAFHTLSWFEIFCKANHLCCDFYLTSDMDSSHAVIILSRRTHSFNSGIWIGGFVDPTSLP